MFGCKKEGKTFEGLRRYLPLYVFGDEIRGEIAGTQNV
jgi:hypothetical protein